MNAKTATTPITVSDNWMSYPLVKEAIRRAGAEGLDGFTVLSTLSNLLGEIEAKCPNVDYLHLFDSQNVTDQPTLNRVGANMRALGASDELVAELTNGRVVAAGAERYMDRQQKQAIVREAIADGQTITQAAEAAGVSWDTAKRYMKADVKPAREGGKQNEIGQYAEQHGYKAAMSHFGCSKAHALNCRKKVRTGIDPRTEWRRNNKESAV